MIFIRVYHAMISIRVYHTMISIRVYHTMIFIQPDVVLIRTVVLSSLIISVFTRKFVFLCHAIKVYPMLLIGC